MNDKKIHRDYGMFIDSSKYNRNWGFKFHDNAYGIKGGGGRAERLKADRALLAHMREHKDPMALPVYIACRAFGWALFNYHGKPWRGQLLKRVLGRK